MLKIGDMTKVRIIGENYDTTAKVVDSEGNTGILKIKGRLKIRADGTVSVWVIQKDKATGQIVYGNSYFGKYTISPGIADKYISAIEHVFEKNNTLPSPDDISNLKGMANRCLRHDQWDWFTTWSYLGYPDYRYLDHFVGEANKLRKEIVAGSFSSLEAFRIRYQMLLWSIYSHLTNCQDIDEERLDTPILGFDQVLWAKLLYDSKKNIILVEQTDKQISKYLLMHYFVTLEQEFQHNFIQPFQQRYHTQLNCASISDMRWKITHDILCGTTHFSLGSIFYLGKCLTDRNAIVASDAIRLFNQFLLGVERQFSSICFDISNKRVCGMLIKDLRNGLAHGDANTIARIDHTAFPSLHDFLFVPPEGILKRILSYSKQT